MKLSRQIIIDKYIGQPVARVSNLLIRLVGILLRPDHSLDREFKTIAVAKYKGMGSIIQCTPLLQSLRRKYPNTRLIFITTKGNMTLLEKIDCVDEVMVLDDSNLLSLAMSTLSLLTGLWKRRVGVFLDLEIYSNASSLITSFSLARNRMGYYLRSSNYRMGMYTHMMFYNIQSPVSETYLQFARLLGCNDIVKNLYSLKGKGSLPEGMPPKYIVVNVNASDLRIERRWEGDKFVELIDRLIVTYPEYRLLLIGSPNEAKYVSEIYNSLKDNTRVDNLAGKTSLNELIGILEKAELLITNDTGPMHLGFALDTKIVALFGPCSPSQYGGNANASVIYKNVYCSPCVHEFAKPPCNGNNQCMKLIGVEDVLNAIRYRLANASQEQVITGNGPVIYLGGDQNTLGIVSR